MAISIAVSSILSMVQSVTLVRVEQHLPSELKAHLRRTLDTCVPTLSCAELSSAECKRIRTLVYARFFLHEWEGQAIIKETWHASWPSVECFIYTVANAPGFICIGSNDIESHPAEIYKLASRQLGT